MNKIKKQLSFNNATGQVKLDALGQCIPPPRHVL